MYANGDKLSIIEYETNQESGSYAVAGRLGCPEKRGGQGKFASFFISTGGYRAVAGLLYYQKRRRLTLQIVLLLVAGMVLLYLCWQLYTLSTKALIIYTRATGQEIKKMVKISDRHVSFDKKTFDLLPETHRLQWHSILGVLGMWVICYHLVWYSRYPQDPRFYNVPVVSPEAKHAMNQEDRYRAYHKSEQARNIGKTKGGGLFGGGWITYVFIGIIIIGLLFLFYSNFSQGADINSIKQSIQDFINK